MAVQAARAEATRGAAVDAVRMAVLNKRIESIASKMQNTLLRTARSGVINNGRDSSCCILTGDARLLCVGESLPIHVMVGTDAMARSMAEFHADLRRGDAFLHNSPYHGCTHAADLSVLVPVIDDQGVHRFTMLAKAHQADIGNAMPTTYMATARDVYEEGALIFAATKVQADYRDIDDIVRMCMMRIRVPEQWRGDYLAALGAARIGERELLAMGAEVGWHILEDHIENWFAYSEQRMAAAISKLPGGRVTATTAHDPFPGTPPEGIPIKAVVDVDSAAARIEVDLADNPDCLPCGLNLSEACARTAAMIGVFNSVGATVPPNAGSFRRVGVTLRENCVVGIPRHPTSCSVATTNLADRLANVVQRAIAELADGFGMAEAGTSQTAANAIVSGRDPRTGSPYCNQLVLADSCGQASPVEDGWFLIGSVGAAGLGMWDSVEVDEVHHPMRIYERCLVPDSEGAGRLRGAPSSRVEYGPARGEMRVVFSSDGTAFPPQGARGGLCAAPARHYKRDGSGHTAELEPVSDVLLVPGESVVAVSCGGGGYGSPLERPTGRVARDVAEGYVTPGRAETTYGVVFEVDGAVDEATTSRVRAQRSAGQMGDGG